MFLLLLLPLLLLLLLDDLFVVVSMSSISLSRGGYTKTGRLQNGIKSSFWMWFSDSSHYVLRAYITLPITWRRETWKEEALDDLQ